MTGPARLRERLRWKAHGARRRAVEAVLETPAVRRRLHGRARAAWSSAESITFVCLGNICRSPFAEAIARRELAHRDIHSAGTFPRSGRPSPQTAVTAAENWAVDLRAHRSRVFASDADDANGAVFVFDVDNFITMWRSHPRTRRRLHLLGLLSSDGPVAIPDPYGSPLERFERVYERIERLIREAARAGSPPAP